MTQLQRPGERPGERPGDEGHLLQSLAQIDRAPDVTGSVMLRLGYRPGSARLAAQRRRRRALSRWAFLMVFGSAIAGALVIELQRPDLRTPAEETLADALSRDLRMHETELFGSVRLIRGLVAPGFLPAGPTIASASASNSEQDQLPVSQRDVESGPWVTSRGVPGGGWRASFGDGSEGAAEGSAADESGDAGDEPRIPGFSSGLTPGFAPGAFPAAEMDAPARELIDRSGIGPIAKGYGRAPHAC